MTSALERVARYLRAKIPAPPAPPRHAQQSWATLREGQRIRSSDDTIIDGVTYPAGTIWTVASPSNLGVYLVEEGGARFSMDNREWKDHYTRVRQARKKNK